MIFRADEDEISPYLHVMDNRGNEIDRVVWVDTVRRICGRTRNNGEAEIRCIGLVCIKPRSEYIPASLVSYARSTGNIVCM